MIAGLLEDAVDVTVDEMAAAITEGDVVTLRRIMLALAQAEQDLARVKALKAAVANEYDVRAASIACRIEAMRESVRAFVVLNGKVSLPDVGTAYLQNPPKPKPKIADVEAANEHAQTLVRGGFVPYAVLFTESLDEGEYLAAAARLLEETGELAPGVEMPEAGEPRLVIRGA